MQQVKNDNVKFFEENKYVKLPQVLNSQVNQLLYEYVKTSAYKCKLIQDWSYFSTHPNYYNIDDHGYFDDPLTPGDFAKYGDMFGTKHSGADYDLTDISEIIDIINKENKVCIT